MFERAHHQRIENVLRSLDSSLLREHKCYFGGGTAIVLRNGEYRESVDMDFLVSDLTSYRELREILTANHDINAIHQRGAAPLAQAGMLRADQYGIRCKLSVAGEAIKFEIVLEGRIELEVPSDEDQVCGIATLTRLDMAASKMLANSDRWADDSVFSRDLIDLAMLDLSLKELRASAVKAEAAYGPSVLRDLRKAIDRLKDREGWLDRCMQTMDVNVPRAVLWQKLRKMERLID